MMEEIEIVLDRNSGAKATLSVFPALDLAIYSIAVKGGLFSGSRFESQAIPLSELDVDLETLREIEKEEEA